jgi:hypothetical protein
MLRNSLFVVLSIASAVVPSIAMSLVSYEFPTLIGGRAGRPARVLRWVHRGLRLSRIAF